MSTREPVLKPVPIRSLRPTQIAVGYREVMEKRKRWRAQGPGKEASYLGNHMIPVIWGPKERYYVTDHHHLARALLDEGVRDILVNVVADYRMVHRDSFWVLLDNRSLCHPYDADGIRRDFSAIPAAIADLEDDPFRSLSGALRRAGGYAKDATPFSEFIWADFLRRHIRRKLVEKDFGRALHQALVLAKDKTQNYLPGWCGPAAGE